MDRAANEWPSERTREYIAKVHDRLLSQVAGIFGESRAHRVIVRAFLRREEVADGDAFEEPRRG